MYLLTRLPNSVRRLLGLQAKQLTGPQDILEGYRRNLVHMIRLYKQLAKFKGDPHRDVDRQARITEELDRKLLVMDKCGFGRLGSMRACANALDELAQHMEQ